MLGTPSGLGWLINGGMGKWVPSVVTILAPELANGIIGGGGGKALRELKITLPPSLKNPTC